MGTFRGDLLELNRLILRRERRRAAAGKRADVRRALDGGEHAAHRCGQRPHGPAQGIATSTGGAHVPTCSGGARSTEAMKLTPQQVRWGTAWRCSCTRWMTATSPPPTSGYHHIESSTSVLPLPHRSPPGGLRFSLSTSGMDGILISPPSSAIPSGDSLSQSAPGKTPHPQKRMQTALFFQGPAPHSDIPLRPPSLPARVGRQSPFGEVLE